MKNSSWRCIQQNALYWQFKCISSWIVLHLLCFHYRLHIVSDTSDDFSAYETVIQPSAHHLTTGSSSSNKTPSRNVYHNPFRDHDLSSFPLDLRQRLAQFPIVTQIAILKNPELQLRYFPEYCYPKNDLMDLHKWV